MAYKKFSADCGKVSYTIKAGTKYNLDFSAFTSDVYYSERKGNNLVLMYGNVENPSAQITLKNYFSSSQNKTNVKATVNKGKNYYNLADYINLYSDYSFSTKSVSHQATFVAEDVIGSSYRDTIVTGQYADGVAAGDGDDTIYSGAGNDVVSGDDGNDYIQGGAGNDTLFGAIGNDYIQGGDGNDKIYGDVPSYSTIKKLMPSEYSDFITYNKSGIEYAIQNAQGADKLYGGNGNDSIYGGKGNDKLYGGNGNDKLYGEDGNDSITGGKGNDYINGGTGNDTYYIGKNDGNDTIVNSSGTDTIKFTNETNISKLTYKISGNNLLIYYNSGKSYVTLKDYLKASTTYGVKYILDSKGNKYTLLDKINIIRKGNSSKKNKITGSLFKDIITGGNANDTLYGKNGNDTIKGGKGNDYINGGNDNDSLYGENGNDTIYGGSGNDTIKGGNDKDKLYGDAGNDKLYGGSGNDTIYGGDGNDSITGGTGNDYLNGGSGNDIYYIGKSDGNDTIVNSSGTDSIKFTKESNISKLTYKVSGNNLLIYYNSGKSYVTLKDYLKYSTTYGVKYILDSKGNKYTLADKINIIQKGNTTKSNKINGTILKDIIYGGNVNDTLNGNNGNDTIKGGKGNDTINGGNDNDTLYGEDGVDTIYGGNGNDTIKGGNDNDNLYGDAGNDKIYGENGNDTIYGGTGNDYIDGGIGNDIINGNNQPNKTDDGSTYIGGLGSDTIYSNNGNDTIYGDLTTTEDADQIQGSADTIYLNSGNNTVYAGGGNDTIYTGSGENIIHTGKDAVTVSISNDDGNNKIYFDDNTVVNTIKYESISELTSNFNGGTGKISAKDSNGIYVRTRIDGDSQTYLELNTVKKDTSGYYQFQNIYNYDANKGIVIEGKDESKVNLYYKPTDSNLTTSNNADIVLTNYKQDYSSISTGDGDDYLYLSDTTTETALNINLGSGNDTFEANADIINSLTIDAGEGDDTIYAYSVKAPTTIYGGDGQDDITGSNTANDVIYGDGGNDLIKGLMGSDTIYGGTGDDELHGYLNNNGIARDITVGTTDELHGGTGNDKLFAESKNNILYGDDGDDTFYLQYGTSDVYGGTGSNLYVARYVTENSQEHEHASVHTIYSEENASTNDKLYFEKNTSLDDLKLHRNDNDLRILYTDNKEVVVKDYFVNNTSCIAEVYVNGAYNSNGIVEDASKISTIENLITNGTLIWDAIPEGGNLTENNDEITVNTATSINALGGNDKITLGKNLSITVNGGDGNDVIYGSDNSTGGSTYIGGNGQDSIYGKSGNDTIYGGQNAELTDASNNYIEGGAGSDTIYGGAGVDTIYTGSKEGVVDTTLYEDTVYAGAGNDIIYAQSKKSTIYAGKGNDTINGYTDTEEYMIYNKGDGIDTISTGTGNKDIIEISGYSKEELIVSQDGNDMVIAGADGDKIILKDAVITDVNPNIIIGGITYGILDSRLYQNSLTEQTSFEGTKFADNITGTAEADILSGGGADDTLSGLAGEDALSGGIGNDLLIGGVDNDRLIGGDGNNTYQFAIGDGTDTVVSTTGGTDTIKFSDIAIGSLETDDFKKVDNNLEITYGTDSDKLILENYFINLPTINLLDKDSNITPLKDKLTDLGIIFASSGDTAVEGVSEQNNIIIGSDGNNTITAHSGNDTMNGGNGDDTYVFYNGDGKDVVIDSNATNADKLKFNDVPFDSLVFEESSNNLIIKYNITSEDTYDSVTVKNYFTETNTVKTIVDSTNTEFDIADKNIHIITMTTTTTDGTGLNDIITGTADADTIKGNLGNDTITAGNGNDIITGGKGNDTINSGIGNDTLKFAKDDGEDKVILTNEQNSDVNVLEFTNLTNIDDLTLTKDNNNLVLSYGTSDKVTLTDYFTSENASTYNTIKIGDETYKITDAFVNSIDESDSETGQTIVGLTNYQNQINGSNFTDTITGGKLSDTIYTNDGDDIVNSGTGADTIYGGKGTQIINAGEGDDTISGGSQTNETDEGSTLIGGLGSDTIYSNNGNDTIYGDLTTTDDVDQTQGGADSIYLNSGNNTVYAGGGNDTIYTGSRENIIHTGKDAVTVSVSYDDGDNKIYFDDDTAVNTIKFENISNLIASNYNGGSGKIYSKDYSNGVFVRTRKDEVNQSYLELNTVKKDTSGYYQFQNIYNYDGDKGVILEGNDESKVYLYFNPAKTSMTTGDTNDIIKTESGIDYTSISTGGGDDYVYLSDTTATTELNINLGSGNDGFSVNYATIQSLTIDGGDGDDNINAYSVKGKTTIYGGAGKDLLEASNEYDNTTTIYGDYGLDTDPTQSTGNDDTIYGNSKNDLIYGGGGNDTLVGRVGSDEIHGGTGDDKIYSYNNNGFSTDISEDSSSTVTMYGDSGNDKIYCQSGINIANGGEGDDAYFARSLTHTSSVTDTSGNDEIVIKDEDAGYHIIFDVNKSGTVTNDSLWVLNDNNYTNWQNKISTTGINIKGGYNSIERITVTTSNSGGNYGTGSDNDKYYYNLYMKQYVTTTQIDSIKSSVAGWISTYNDGQFASVSDVFTNGNSDDITALVNQFNTANDAAWQTARL